MFFVLYNIDMRKIIAQNLAMYRKLAHLTQQELADKLNYTDKAISKWERGDSIPDVVVLKQIADLYGITVDDLLIEHTEPIELNTSKAKKRRNVKRLLVALLSGGLVWLVATVIVVVVGLIGAAPKGFTMLTYITAMPIFFIVLLVFSAIWGKLWMQGLTVSLLVWSLCLMLHMLMSNGTLVIMDAWLIYLIGAAMQVLIVLWYLYKYVHRSKKNDSN